MVFWVAQQRRGRGAARSHRLPPLHLPLWRLDQQSPKSSHGGYECTGREGRETRSLEHRDFHARAQDTSFLTP
jgi:hypothetical protein